MQDAACKNPFSCPRMVEDLLRGFAAKGWSDSLDFTTLEKAPSEFVSEDLRRRRGDGLWRVRFRDASRLHVLVLLEYQSTADPYMAVRMMVYAGLPYQDLIRRGELGPGGELPPVLPVVLYNGRSRWKAAEDVGKLMAPVGEPLARYQPSLRYFVLDERAHREDDLPRGNLVTALIGLETSRTPEALGRAVSSPAEWVRGPGDPELKRAFLRWALWVVMPPGFRSEDLSRLLPQLEEEPTMLAERVKEWCEEARVRGIEQGIERGRAEERALLCRWAARKFDPGTGARLSGLLDRLTAPGPLGEVGDWMIECDTGADLLARVERMVQPTS